MAAILVIILFLLSLKTGEGQVSPNWVRDNNVDAGQVKPINFDVCPTSTKTPGYINTYTQTYNKTNFSVIPKVSMAQLSFDFFFSSSTKMGYQITMGAISLVNFKFVIKTFGVSICGVHFIYIAVSPIYDAYYMMAVYNNSFISSEPVSNTSLGSTRSQTINHNFPGSVTLPTNTSNYKIQNWILYYLFTPQSTFLAINTSSTFSSTTQFALTVQVWAGMQLDELGVTVVLVNTLALFQYSYAIYLDVIINNQQGNGNPINATSTTITNFQTQYFYRNTLFGITGGYINFTASPGLTYFFYNATSYSQSLFSGYGFSMRTRECDSSHTYFFYENQTCIPNCPYYYYTNVTHTYCILCHYSCKNCTSPASSSACSLCDSAMLRELTNSSCSCELHYFDNNTLLCAPCENTCLTCFNQLANGCITCNTTLNRQISNSSCICSNGYYDNGVIECAACPTGCLICNNASFCTSCDTINNWALFNHVCSCAPTYAQSGQICIFTTGICGNGILQTGQQCDDNNVVQEDGCSSICTVQTDFTCINNASLYAYSLCYYSGTITLNVNYIYKVPLQNSVQLEIVVSAQNINHNILQTYLQTQTAIVFGDTSRLLIESTIINKTTVYNTNTHKLSIDFSYTSDIDLSTVAIHFLPSLSIGATTRYFYLTPQTKAILSQPDNKLLTTFATNSDIVKYKTISWLFLGIIIASWIFLFISIAYNQGVVAVQYFLVLQTTYESLLQSGFIYDGWVGLVLFGKYTYGINIDSIVETSSHDTLNIIGLTASLLNTLNLTVAFILVATVVLIAIFLYETADHLMSKDKQIQEMSEKGTEAKVVPTRLNEQINYQSYQIKRGIVIFCLQVSFSLTFLTAKIVAISIITGIKQSLNVGSYLLPALVAIGCQIAIIIFYYKCYNLQFLQELSYRRLLKELKSTDSETSCRLRSSNILVKYHYLILLTLSILFSLINSLTSLGIAFYIVLIVGSIAWIAVTFINRTYLRKVHRIRVTINTISFIAMMILLLLQTNNILDPSQTISPPLIGLVILSVSLCINIGVFINVEYRRRRKKLITNKVINSNAIIVHQNHGTEGPIEPIRQVVIQINQRVNIDNSQIELGGKQKFQDFGGEHNDSRQYTQKKIIPNNRDHQMTKQRHKEERWEQQDKDRMDQTRPKGWNIQKQQMITKMESLNSRKSVNGKMEVQKSLKFR